MNASKVSTGKFQTASYGEIMRIISALAFVTLLLPFPSLIASDSGMVESATPGAASPAVASETPGQKRIREKLQSIIFDKCNFETFDLTKILPYLTKRSKELDPDHIGVQFILRGPYTPPPPSTPIHREVSMSLQDVPLSEVIGYVCSQTDHAYKIEDDAVIVYPAKGSPN
jgi:hypothetical protein